MKLDQYFDYVHTELIKLLYFDLEQYIIIPYMNTTTHVFWCRRCCVLW